MTTSHPSGPESPGNGERPGGTAPGGFSSSSLFIGEALAAPRERHKRTTGLVMGFGAGTLLSAVAYPPGTLTVQ